MVSDKSKLDKLETFEEKIRKQLSIEYILEKFEEYENYFKKLLELDRIKNSVGNSNKIRKLPFKNDPKENFINDDNNKNMKKTIYEFVKNAYKES
jgi:hypothetical protein